MSELISLSKSSPRPSEVPLTQIPLFAKFFHVLKPLVQITLFVLISDLSVIRLKELISEHWAYCKQTRSNISIFKFFLGGFEVRDQSQWIRNGISSTTPTSSRPGLARRFVLHPIYFP